MLLLLFLSKNSSRPHRPTSRAQNLGVAFVPVLLAIVAVSLLTVLGVANLAAAAQSEDAEDNVLDGLSVTVENTFASEELTDGEEIVFGSAGPVEISDGIEFDECCDDFYDIDVASDRITMTWIGDDEYARTIEDGTFDRYRFTVVGATFADAVADTEQNLVPDVTFFANSISVKIAEGAEVGPGQDAVILLDPIVTAESRAAAEAVAETAAADEAADSDADDKDASADDDADGAAGDADDKEMASLPRTGPTTEVLTSIGLFVLALGLIAWGVGNRARRLEIL